MDYLKSTNSILSIFLIILGTVFVQGQVAPTSTRTFTSGDISFNYPSSWKVTEKSSKPIQQVNIVPDQGNVLIIVSVFHSKIDSENEFSLLKEQVTKPRVGKIAAGFASFTEAGECIQFKEKNIPGQVISGLYGKEPATSSSFSVVMNKKFIHLLYLREDRTKIIADTGWKTILETLTIKGGNPKEPIMFDKESDEFLNGKAIKLPKPISPGSTSYTLVVPVRILIDENGDVISAKAVDGDFKFRYAAEMAAKQAKFLPTSICGEITKISGRIYYQFNSR